MRIVRITLIAVALVALPTPAGAAPLGPPPLSFTRTPAIGPNQSTILVQGTCKSASGTASLRFPVRSDALRAPLDSRSFTVSNNQFEARLGVNYAASFPVGSTPPDPVDLEVAVSCGDEFVVQPFTMTARGGSAPTIFTVLADGACGHGLAQTEAEARIPCPRHVKGVTAGGEFTPTNAYVTNSEPGYLTNGGTIAVGDVDNDGDDDLVTGDLPGEPAFVNLTAQDGTLMGFIDPYGRGYVGGINVAVGDLNGDGRDDIVTAPGPGGGPHVRAFTQDANGGFSDAGGFMAYDPNFSGGVTVAVADLNGDGKGDIVTGAGPGGGPHVRVFSANGSPLAGFMAYDANFRGGVFVAAGTATGHGPEIVTGAGPGGGPHVRVFNADGSPIGGGFMAYNSAFGGGVAVAVGSVGIVTVPARGGGPHVRTFANADGGAVNNGFMSYDVGDTGLRVAAAK